MNGASNQSTHRWWHDFGNVLMLVTITGLFLLLIVHPEAGQCSVRIRDTTTATTTILEERGRD